MKKYWYIAIAVVVVLLVAGNVYVFYQSNHPDSSYDAIPRELRKEMLANWPEEKYGDSFFGNKNICYYGTHGDCVVFCDVGRGLGLMGVPIEIAKSHFCLDRPFSIHVYHSGEFVELQEAYDRGWLNRWQIRSIAEYHKQYWGGAAEK